MKYLIGAVLTGLAGLAVVVPSASADPPGGSSAFCRDQNHCFVAVTDTQVSLGAIRTNRRTTAAWALRCRQGSHRSIQRGVALPGTTTRS